MRNFNETDNPEIVIVDDDEHSLRLLTDLLSAAGYTVRSASSGPLALRSIQAKAPALVLLDIQMPGMDGYEVCQRLKADAQTSVIPIIFISVLDHPRDKVKGFQMGGADYIIKPFEEMEVLARIKAHLALRRTQAELERRAAELEAMNTQLNVEINERKQAEKALQQHQAHLEELIAERTAKLQQDILERKRIEEALQANEGQLHAFLNALQETAFLMDVQGMVLAANTMAAQRLDTTVERFVCACAYDFLPPELARQRKAYVERVVRTGQPVQFEDRRNERMFRNILYPVKDVAGQVQSVAVLAIDITTQKQTEAALQTWATFAQMHPAPVLRFDREGKILIANSAAYDIFGHQALQDRTIVEIFPECPSDIFAEGIQHETRVNVEVRLGGQDYQFLVCGVPALGIGHVYGTNITERKRAEEALRESEIRYRMLFEEAALSLWEEDLSEVKRYIETLRAAGIDDFRTYFTDHPEAVFACAARVKVLEVNKATLTLYQACTQDELFRNFASIFCEASIPGLREGFCAIAEGQTWCRHEALNRRLNGEACHLIVHWVTMPGYETTYKRVLVSVIDWTELKQAEHERRLNEMRLSALLQLYQMVATPIPQIADFALEQGIQLTDSAMGFLIFLNDDETLGMVHAWSKTAMAACAIVDKPLQFVIADTGLWGEVVRQRQPVLINDYAAPHPKKKGFPSGHVSISRYLSIPVFEANRIVAVAAVANKEAAYNDADVRQLQLFMQGMWGILQRKQMEETLRQANAYNRSLLEASLDPVVTIGADGKIMDVNTATELATGYARQNLIGADFSDYFTEPERARAGYRQVFRDGLVRDYPLELRHRDGHVIAVLYNAAVYRDETGQVLGVFAAARDITERKQIEEALTKSEHQLRLIADNLPIFISYVDANQVYRFVNHTYEEFFHTAREHILGRTMQDVIDHLTYAKIQPYIKAALSGATVRFENQFLSDSGALIWFDGTYVPDLDQNGCPLGIFMQIVDITGRKRVEESLRQAKDVAEAASLAKTQFLANISHELRTPLNTILGYAQLFRKHQNLTEPQQQSVDIILRSGEHLLAIINDLLDLSAIETGQITLSNQPFVLHSMAHDIILSLQAQAEAKGLILGCEIASDLPSVVSGDEMRLRQILLNLLSNAIKFTRQGRVILRAAAKGAEQEAEGEGREAEGKTPLPFASRLIRFEVEDTGVGIPAEELEAVFTPFYQVSAERSKPKGTGLGLPISRRLARLMQSEIYVQSQVGQGSVFWFDLILTAASIADAVISTRMLPPALAPEPEDITPPPSEELAVLYELARIGNIRDLRKRLVELDVADPCCHAFVHKLTALARDIKLQEIRAYLHQCLEESQ